MSQSAQSGDGTPSDEKPPIVIKKYANRRLYNTESSSYITLDNLAAMVRQGREFVVYDAKSGDDITRSVLTQIIVEEESKGNSLLPIAFLRQLIGLYGDSIQGLVPRYLEQAMSAFARQQEQLREAMKHTVGNLFPFSVEELGRQNMAMMERAIGLFSPFYQPPDGRERKEQNPAQELAALRAEVERLRRELAEARRGRRTAETESE
jgi:polyhydroxyalkanoate synthesis repressor PhaR